MENNWANDPQHPGPKLHLVSSVHAGKAEGGGGGAADNLSPFPA